MCLAFRQMPQYYPHHVCWEKTKTKTLERGVALTSWLRTPTPAPPDVRKREQDGH